MGPKVVIVIEILIVYICLYENRISLRMSELSIILLGIVRNHGKFRLLLN